MSDSINGPKTYFSKEIYYWAETTTKNETEHMFFFRHNEMKRFDFDHYSRILFLNG